MRSTFSQVEMNNHVWRQGALWPGWFSPTDSDRAADGVVQAAQVVHLAAFCGVMEGRGGEEAEVVGGARDVHRPGKAQSFSCPVGGCEVCAFG